MANIVSLRLVRKQNDRGAARTRAIEAAAKSGRSKALKQLEKARADKAASDLDGKQREGRAGAD